MRAHGIRHVALSAMLIGLFLTDVDAIEPFRVLGQTNAPGLRMRTEANIESTTLGSLPEETRIEIVDVTAELMTIGSNTAQWYRIQPLPGGTEPAGWSYGAFIDVRPANQLALAITVGNLEVVRLLLESGADPNHLLVYESLLRGDRTLKSPVNIAVEMESSSIAALIRSYGGKAGAGLGRHP